MLTNIINKILEIGYLNIALLVSVSAGFLIVIYLIGLKKHRNSERQLLSFALKNPRLMHNYSSIKLGVVYDYFWGPIHEISSLITNPWNKLLKSDDVIRSKINQLEKKGVKHYLLSGVLFLHSLFKTIDLLLFLLGYLLWWTLLMIMFGIVFVVIPTLIAKLLGYDWAIIIPF